MHVDSPEPEMSTTDVDRAAVFKQRRLLLSLTFALMAVHGLDVELSGNVTAQGLVLTFKHPIVIVIAMWIAWAWAYWRYWQYEQSYGGSALANQRLHLIEKAAQQAVIESINRGVKNGLYVSQGVQPTEKVNVTPSIGHPFQPMNYSDKEWFFPNLDLHVTRSNQTGFSVTTQTRGANCTLDSKDIKRLKKAVEKQLLLSHTSYADYKAPYLIAMFAPASVLFTIVRHYCF